MPCVNTELDHLVVAAETLEQGVDHLEVLLGVRATPGGKHDAQGTHNALIRLGVDRYLEIIAVDPEANAPQYPRWFGLDDPVIRRQVAESPRFLTWVARTDSLQECLARSDRALGEVRSMRRGDLRWRMTFTADGALIEDGLLPPLIEWNVPVHPARRLEDVGCQIIRIEGYHPDPTQLRRSLDVLGLCGEISISRSQERPSGLAARILTPDGEKTLDTVGRTETFG